MKQGEYSEGAKSNGKHILMGPREASASDVAELAAMMATPGWEILMDMVTTNKLLLAAECLIPATTDEGWQRRVTLNSGAASIYEDLLRLKPAVDAKLSQIKELDKRNKP